MKGLFSIRLYFEGLKKIRLIGIVSAIVCVVLSAIIPVIVNVFYFTSYIADGDITAELPTMDIPIGFIASPMLWMLLFAPLYIFNMFSYLNSRKKSDFYHAIPYKRGTVYFSFLMAALSWCLAVIVTSVTVCALLWGLSPITSYDIISIPLLILSTFLACTILLGFAALSMSLTGTGASNLFVFSVSVLFVRIVLALFSSTLSAMTPIWVIGDALGRFLEFSFFMPFSLFIGLVDSEAYLDVALYVYTAAVSMLLFAAAGLAYKLRRSEMAGKSAPSRLLQHIYRIAFTTPLVLGTVSIILMGDMNIALFIFLSFVTLQVYFLYELITTRSPMNMLKAAPFLCVFLIISSAFSLGILVSREMILTLNPNYDDIVYVQIPEMANLSNDNYYSSNSYEMINCRGVKLREKDVKRIVAEGLRYSVRAVREGTYDKWNMLDEDTNERTSYVAIEVNVKTRYGVSVRRNIKLSESEYKRLYLSARDSDEFLQEYLKIPKQNSIYSASVTQGHIDYDKALEIYKCFYEEYNALSDDTKYDIKAGDGSFSYRITYNVREMLNTSVFVCRVGVNTPRTLELVSKALTNSRDTNITYEGIDVSSLKTSGDVLLYAVDHYKEHIYTLDKDEAYNRFYDKTDSSFSLTCSFYDSDGSYLGDAIIEDYDDGMISEVSDMRVIEELFDSDRLDTELDEGDIIVKVRLDFSYSDNDNYIYTNLNVVMFADRDIDIDSIIESDTDFSSKYESDDAEIYY